MGLQDQWDRRAIKAETAMMVFQADPDLEESRELREMTVLLASQGLLGCQGVELEHRAPLALWGQEDFLDHLASREQMDLTAIPEREVPRAHLEVQGYLVCLAPRAPSAPRETRAVLVSLDCLVSQAIPAREVLPEHQAFQE